MKHRLMGCHRSVHPDIGDSPQSRHCFPARVSMGIEALLFSRFGMAVVELVVRKPKNWLELVEVRPLFNPHPPEELTREFASLLPHLVSSVNEEVPPDTSPEILKIVSDLQAEKPDEYTGNAYHSLIRAGILPQGGPWALVRGVADCTPDDDVSNKTRWALQLLLAHYVIHFGSAEPNQSFLYVWHDTAFQFAGQSRTIGKLAWHAIAITPANKLGEWLACEAIKYTNQPDGTIPALAVPIREGIDAASRLLYE